MRTLFIRYEGFKKRSDTLAAVLRVGGGREKEDEGENCISRTPGRRSIMEGLVDHGKEFGF